MSLAEIEENIKTLNLAKKKILKERNPITDHKLNQKLYDYISKHYSECKNKVETAKSEGRTGWLNKLIWRNTKVQKIHFACKGVSEALQYSQMAKLLQKKANDEDKVIKGTYSMRVITTVEVEYYPEWKCPVCLRTMEEKMQTYMGIMANAHIAEEDEDEEEPGYFELKCKHKICNSCYDKCNDSGNSKCPMCRTDFTQKERFKKISS